MSSEEKEEGRECFEKLLRYACEGLSFDEAYNRLLDEGMSGGAGQELERLWEDRLNKLEELGLI